MGEDHARAVLTGVMVKIRQVAGEEAAAKILQAYGGGRMCVPVRAGKRSALTRLVGLDAARKIAAAIGCGAYEIQVARTAAPSLKMRILAASGSTIEVARRLGCSERYVRMVRAYSP